MTLLAELKRRNVIRMAGLYLVGAWLVTQVAGTLLPMFGAPDWAARTVVILLAIGFVPALVVSWVFELTPGGLKRDAEVSPAESIAPQTAQRMNRTLLVVMTLALAYFAIDKFVLAPARDAHGDVASAADTEPDGATPPKAARHMCSSACRWRTVMNPARSARLSRSRALRPLISRMMNWPSCISGIWWAARARSLAASCGIASSFRSGLAR